MFDSQVGGVSSLIEVLPPPFHLAATGRSLTGTSLSDRAARRSAASLLALCTSLATRLLTSVIWLPSLLTLTLLTLTLLTLTLLTLTLLSLTLLSVAFAAFALALLTLTLLTRLPLLTLARLTLARLTLARLTLARLTLATRGTSAAAGLASAVAGRASRLSTRLAVGVLAL